MIVAITGTSRGVGRALAHHLSSRGDQVFGCSRSGDDPPGAGFSHVQADLTAPDGPRSFFRHVRHAAASAALRLAASLRPSLCLAEWQLDGYQGPRLIGELRAASPTTRVIITTVFGSIAAARLAFRGGASGYLTKPVSAQDVFALLAEAPRKGEDDREVRSGHWLTLDAARREYIREVLARCGTVAETARVLGIDRRSLRRMLARFELLPRRPR